MNINFYRLLFCSFFVLHVCGQRVFVLPFAYQSGHAYALFRIDKARVSFFGGIEQEKKKKKGKKSSGDSEKKMISYEKLAKLFSYETKLMWAKYTPGDEQFFKKQPQQEHFRHSVATASLWFSLAQEKGRTITYDKDMLYLIEVPFITQELLVQAPMYTEYHKAEQGKGEFDYVWLKLSDLFIKKNQKSVLKDARTATGKSYTYDGSVSALLTSFSQDHEELFSSIVHPPKETLDKFRSVTTGVRRSLHRAKNNIYNRISRSAARRRRLSSVVRYH